MLEEEEDGGGETREETQQEEACPPCKPGGIEVGNGLGFFAGLDACFRLEPRRGGREGHIDKTEEEGRGERVALHAAQG